ncbi:MAG TPA: chorismate synthase [Desulfobacteria bacterium]|nr:chorismate synthase [Desulfobacteria bacterium]
MRFLTAGESHGPALTAILEGIPAGVALTAQSINTELARRQKGYGRGGRMQIEKDRVKILSGVRGGLTTGSPLTLMVENRDWQNWESVMSPHPDAQIQERTVTRPRPGHADLSGALKYRQTDIRNILERASARETTMRVAAGGVAKELLYALGVQVFGHVVRIGSANLETEPEKDRAFWERVEQSPVSCGDSQVEQQMIAEIDRAKAVGESLGGVFEIIVYGLPPGLGSHVQWDRKLDGRLSQAVMSIQAIKAVEFGLGFAAAGLPGSQVHDEIAYQAGKGYYHLSNQAGGIEGGMTNGEPLLIRAAMKPIPTLYTPLTSVDMKTKQATKASVERSDTCAVPAAAVVAEAAVAWELANAFLEKFPGDHLEELQGALQNYLKYLQTR